MADIGLVDEDDVWRRRAGVAGDQTCEIPNSDVKASFGPEIPRRIGEGWVDLDA